MRQLRTGVKLKKVEHINHCASVEYELTPYEMLMEDIRTHRYQLNKIMVNLNALFQRNCHLISVFRHMCKAE